jgi:PAS domain S-box-containing protein
MTGPVQSRLDRLPCGIVAFRDDGTIIDANATLLDRVGYARDELTGRHIETILGAGSRIFHQTHFFPLVRLHGAVQEIFLLLRAKSGEDVGMLCNAVRRDDGGMPVTECVLMEVRERRKFEDALLRAKQEAERATAQLQEANEQLETAAVEQELQHQQLYEQATELEAQSEALHELNTELTQRTEELHRQREAANEANRAKSTFLAVMSHELRTPLNAINGYVQLLEMEIQGPLTKTQRESLSRIDRSQRHLLRLINDVLNLSRIEAGRVDYLEEAVPLWEVVTNVMPLVERQIAARGLRSDVDVPTDLVAVGDRDKVQQILINLLTNAVKFTDEGGAIGVTAGTRDGERVIVRVRDSGRGIAPDMLERIFEPFVQVDASRTRASEGTGLGLAISRDLARGMKGDLVAESTPGEGSVFTVTLPSA